MVQKLGRRGRELFTREMKEKSQFVVEYFPSIDEDTVWQQAQNIYKKGFGIVPQKQDVMFLKKESL